MQKLKFAVLDQMVQNKLTSAEINFIIYLSHYQDDAGIIRGVYYRDIMEKIGISTQKFYDILKGLEAKGIIRIEKSFHADWDVRILQNDFTYEGALKEGYLNMQHNIFHDAGFLKLKAGEKLLAMQILKIAFIKEEYSYSNAGSYCIGTAKFYQKYMETMGVTRRILQSYLTKLRKWFSIGIKNHIYYITPLRKVYRNGTKKDAELYREHMGKVACRRGRLTFTRETFRDAAALATQFEKKLKAPLMGAVFLDAVARSIQRANEHIKNPKDWKRILQPKLINKCITEKIMELGLGQA